MLFGFRPRPYTQQREGERGKERKKKDRISGNNTAKSEAVPEKKNIRPFFAKQAFFSPTIERGE